jgi:uncharacterized protein YbaR (Trm112 family)
MTLDHRLLSLLVCPLCKGPLQLRRSADSRPQELLCPADRLAFPVRDGMPVMLEGEARNVGDDEVSAAPAAPAPR